jgi:hypothetical protein
MGSNQMKKLLALTVALMSTTAQAGWFDKKYTCESPEVIQNVTEQLAGVFVHHYNMSMDSVKNASKEEILKNCNEWLMPKCNSVFDCNRAKLLCELEADTIHTAIQIEESSTSYAVGANPDIGQYQCIRKRVLPFENLEELLVRFYIINDLGAMPADFNLQVWPTAARIGKTQEDWDFYLEKGLRFRARMNKMMRTGPVTEEIPFTVQPSSEPPGFLVRFNLPELEHLKKAY